MRSLAVIQNDIVTDSTSSKRPAWLRVRAPAGERYHTLRRLLLQERLHTVCDSAACPNMGECWNNGTATFMILGHACTRACRFCDVMTTTTPDPVDLDEPARLAKAAALMGLSHVVITSVARDDLPDGGALQFARCITSVKQALPRATVEVLVPDFGGSSSSIKIVTDVAPAIFNHNVETVPRMTKQIRSGALYERSLDVLASAKSLNPAMKTKSGIMLGLGETDDEVREVISDLRSVNVAILTIGQYLRPSKWHHEVARYADLDVFAAHKQFAQNLGFSHVESGPLVRSSYHAERAI